MPAFGVALNGQFHVSVETSGLDLLEVNISGDRLGPEPAHLRISGGAYADGKVTSYLIWEDDRALVVGDSVSVSFDEDGRTSRPGKTIEELYPGETPRGAPAFLEPEKVVEELKQRPKVFDTLSFRAATTHGVVAEGSTRPEEHAFAFGVPWVSHRPDRVRVSLHTYSLDSLVSKEVGTYHLDAKIQIGQGATFTLAPNSTVETDARKTGARRSP
jgi:hypothetical protein